MEYAKAQYWVTFGTGDSSDCIDTEVELDDEEAAVYKHALLMRMPLNDIPELQSALDRAYKEIEKEEIATNTEIEDEYTLECAGETEVDPDEINELVANRDEYTLDYFELSELSDEELDEWDANDLDDLPYICDFYEDFEPESPYDQGLDLTLKFVAPYEDEYLVEKEAKKTLTKLFTEANSDYSLINEFISRNKDNYKGGDLVELAKHIAEENNINDFVLEIKEY